MAVVYLFKSRSSQNKIDFIFWQHIALPSLKGQIIHESNDADHEEEKYFKITDTQRMKIDENSNFPLIFWMFQVWNDQSNGLARQLFPGKNDLLRKQESGIFGKIRQIFTFLNFLSHLKIT